MIKIKRGKLLLIIAIIVGILVVGVGGYFVYDKYFSNSDVENKKDDINKENNADNNKQDNSVVNSENKENKEKKTVKATILEDNRLDYDDNYVLGDDIVIENFKFNGKTGKLVLNISATDNDNGNDADYILSVYFNDLLYGVVNLISGGFGELYVNSYNKYIIVYKGVYFSDFCILGNDIYYVWRGDVYDKIKGIFDGIIYRSNYREKENYILEEYEEAINLTGDRVVITSKFKGKINCNEETEENKCLCMNHFNDISYYQGSQCAS